jgi:hypothetical protein
VLAVSDRVSDLEEALGAGRVPCPRCGRGLRPWGYARARLVRELGSPGRWWRPRRAWCGSCSVTHVLLPASLVPRRKDSAQVIGTALVAKAGGTGHRRIAKSLDRPAATVRGWIRSFRARAESLRVEATAWAMALDVLAPPIPAVSRAAVGLRAAKTRKRPSRKG